MSMDSTAGNKAESPTQKSVDADDWQQKVAHVKFAGFTCVPATCSRDSE